MLLAATLEALRGKAAPRVVLSTAERNESAQRLFARAGQRPLAQEGIVARATVLGLAAHSPITGAAV